MLPSLLTSTCLWQWALLSRAANRLRALYDTGLNEWRFVAYFRIKFWKFSSSAVLLKKIIMIWTSYTELWKTVSALPVLCLIFFNFFFIVICIEKYHRLLPDLLEICQSNLTIFNISAYIYIYATLLTFNSSENS